MVIVCKDNPKITGVIEGMIRDSISEVSEEYLVRRVLDCDVALGRDYGSVH